MQGQGALRHGALKRTLRYFSDKEMLFPKMGGDYGRTAACGVKMRTIGILGGMSASSTQLYYRELCRLTRERLGGLHSPELLIRSLDFAPISELQARGVWDAAARILNREAATLVRGGAQVIVLATNTMHKLADEMMAGLPVPMVHIADATAAAIAARGLARPGLMATAFTMEQPFYVGRLRVAGLQPVLPDAESRAVIHRIIYDELCREVVTERSCETFRRIAAGLAEAGADSLILGCTEVGMLLDQSNVALPVFDSLKLHCCAALDLALAGQPPA